MRRADTMAKTTTKTTDKVKAAGNAAKNFRANTDVENFYRFIHENSLRHEARTLVEYVLSKVPGKTKSTRKRKAKTLQ